ncbi:MAG: helix-turn-helix transcriptional regulator [Phenylobacterium sp.]
MNRVAKFRAKAKLSQRALAAQVGVSQQTIQRIEAEAGPVRFETAKKLAAALRAPLRDLFPESPESDHEHQSSAHGMDYSHATHTLRMRFTDGIEKDYVVDAASLDRARHALHNSEPQFLLLETPELTVIVNTGEVLWTNIRFDVGTLEDRGQTVSDELRVYFRGSAEASSFSTEPDVGSLDDGDEDGVKLQDILATLEGCLDLTETEVLTFLDKDGEEVIFTSRRLKLLEVPSHLVNPKLLAAMDAGWAEDERMKRSLLGS